MNARKNKIVMFNPKASPKMPYDAHPLAILTAVSMLDESVYEICVIDWHYDRFEELLRDACRDAFICGITSMTGYQLSTMLQGARIAKASNPDIIVVCGGCHPTLMPEQTLANHLVDMVVIGQGPRTFAELVAALANGTDLHAVDGIGFKENGRAVLTTPRPRTDINTFPPVPYHLLKDFDQFLPKTSFAQKTFYYLTSEGCTGNCKFCAEESLYHRKWRSLDIPRVIDDIVSMRAKYAFDGVAISDSNFYVSEKRVAEFCEKMIPLGLKWGGTSARPDQLSRYSDATLALMKQSGLSDIFLGVESGSDDTLVLMDKKCVIQDTLNILPRLHKHGIRVQCSFVIGVPGVEIKEDFRSTMKFINYLRSTAWVSQFHLFVYTPLPGTRFIADAVKQGYCVPQTLEEWTKYELHADIVPWVPKRYSQFTDAASIYFMFLAGHAKHVISAIMPRSLQWLGWIMYHAMRGLSDFRISTSCFVFPVEYHVIKWVLLRKDRLFGKKKLLF